MLRLISRPSSHGHHLLLNSSSKSFSRHLIRAKLKCNLQRPLCCSLFSSKVPQTPLKQQPQEQQQQQQAQILRSMAGLESKEKFQRLPKNVYPTHYTVCLQPDLEKFTFEGSELVDVTVNEETDTIILNSSELTIEKVVWQDEGTGAKKEPKEIKLEAENELLKIHFDSKLPVGNGTLRINFAGILNDKMKGFYRSNYKGADGVERWNAVTQFEATDCRKCFPSWDEPAIKSTFDLSLIVPKHLAAISNMPIKVIVPHTNEALHIVEYDRTPIMSTYLVAFIVGEFEYVEATAENGILCRVYTQVGKKEQGRFALDVCTKVLPYYEKYFNVKYPLKKLDMVAIADFSSGAMENWGCITYRESCILVDPKETSASSRQWIAIVVAHELGHQWFGNLVTMQWWTSLWLNEGFASFVEYLTVDYAFPEYEIWKQMITSSYITALELDALKNSHPIEVPVEHPSEIDEIFDDISYNKGASIIRMLHHYIGDDAFRKGMNIYLERHKYKNAETDDLWIALGEASSKPIDIIMSTWTKQKGFPLLNVKSRMEGLDRVIELEQEKFCADPNDQERLSGNYLWMIPVFFSCPDGSIVSQVLMDRKNLTVTLPGVSDQWIKINPQAYGFYRVNYPPQDLAQFIPAIKSKTLSPIDRLQILDDLSALVQAGKSSTADLLKIMEAYAEETDYTVWACLDNIMGKLNVILGYTDFHEDFKAWGRKLYKGVADRVGWNPKENEDHLGALLRSLVLGRMVRLGHEPTLEESKRRIGPHLSGEGSIPADLRNVVYRGVLSSNDKELFESMLKLYRDSDLHEEKDRIGRSLGAIKDGEMLRKVLEFSISEDVRTQDSVFIIISASVSSVGRDLAWDFFKENEELFRSRYPGGHLLNRLVKSAFENFASEEKAKEISTYFEEHSFRGIDRAVQQIAENVRLNAGWLARDKDEIRGFLGSSQSQ